MSLLLSFHQNAAKLEEHERTFVSLGLADATTLPNLKQFDCAARAGNRLLLGSATGLYALSAAKLLAVGDLKKVMQIQVTMVQSSFIVSAAKKKESHLYLFGINAALRGRDDGIKIVQSKGHQMFTMADFGSRTQMAFVCRNCVTLCEIQPQRCQIIAAIDINGQPASLSMLGGRLCVGHNFSFTLVDWGPAPHTQPLVASSDDSLRLLQTRAASMGQLNPVAAFMVFEGAQGRPTEFLLCFNFFGVFVTEHGRRSRPMELKWTGRSSACLALPSVAAHVLRMLCENGFCVDSSRFWERLKGAGPVRCYQKGFTRVCHWFMFPGPIKHFHFASPFLLCSGRNYVEIVNIATGVVGQVMPMQQPRPLSMQEPLWSSAGVSSVPFLRFVREVVGAT